MDVDPQTQAQMLGALIRTFLTLAALVATLRYMIAPIVIEWYRLRKRERAALLKYGPRRLWLRALDHPPFDDSPPDAGTTRHGTS